MALNNFNGNQFDKKITFGTDVKKRNENDGTMKQVYKELIGPFYCAPYSRTMHQNFQTIGTKFEHSKQVGVKHQYVGSKLTKQMHYARIGQTIYQIIDNNGNDTGNPNGVDILSLQEADNISLPKGDEANG